MSSTPADTYPESVGSCRPPTPPTSPPPHPAPAAALRSGPVRRQLDFADADAGGDLDDNDLIREVIRVADDIEWGYNEAKRRAPPCVCGRGDCAVQQDVQSGGWMYVCSSQPKCKHVAIFKDVHQNPQSPPVVRSDPKPSNPCAFNVPRTPVDDARTQINNVNPQGAGATTPINVSPQAAVATTQFNCTFKGVGATTPVHVSPHGAGAIIPINISPQAAIAATPLNYTPKGVGATSPVHVSPQGANATTAVKVSPRCDRSNDGPPICQCSAGKCKILKVGNEDCYVCPVTKGHGACSYKVPVKDVVKGPPQIGEYNLMEAHGNNAVGVRDNNANGSANPAQPNDDEWRFEIINNEIVPHDVVQQNSPSTPRQPIAMARTPAPATSPLTPFGSRSPVTPRPNDACYRCGELGHWSRDCPPRQPIAMARIPAPATSPLTPFGSRSPVTPRLNDACYRCGELGHWSRDCPKPSPGNRCSRLGMVGHWKANCPQPRRS